MPCCNHSHRETRKSVWMCAESTATAIVRGGRRGTIRHASAHTEQRPQPAEQKQRGEKNDPKSRQLHAWRASCSRVTISAGDASQRPAFAKSIHAEHFVNTYFLCAGKAERGAQGGKSTQQEAKLDDSNTCGTAPNSTITHGGGTQHPTKTKTKKKTKEKKTTAAGCGCVCVVLRVSARPGRKKQKTRGKENVCSAPQALVARPHVTAPSARRSSRPLLMRAAGEAHRAVVMSVSVGVRVEQLGGKHTAPLTGRVQKKQLKREE
ncbi:hypothetical protein TCSYLVIO_005272 [Trypanosoma cruzi]|nr:hypothetical protein TCSYLVIO_005272 [Trypanosoma cruzi]